MMSHVYRVTGSLEYIELDCDIVDSILEKNGIDCDRILLSDEKADEWIVDIDVQNHSSILEKIKSPLQGLHGRYKYCLYLSLFEEAQPSLPARSPREDLNSRRHSFEDTDKPNSTVVSEVRQKIPEVKDTEFQLLPNFQNLTNVENYEDFQLNSSFQLELMKKYQQKVEKMLQPYVKPIWSKSNDKVLKIEYSEGSTQKEALKKLEYLLQNIHEDTFRLPTEVVSQAIALTNQETSDAIVSVDPFNQTLQIAAFDEDNLSRLKKQFMSLTYDKIIISNYYKIHLLFAERLQQIIEQKYSGIRIENGGEKIIIRGPDLDTSKVEKEMHELLERIEGICIELPKYTSFLLKNKSVKSYISGKLKHKNCPATWEMQENDSVIVYYLHGDQKQIVKDVFKSSFRALNFTTGDMLKNERKLEIWKEFRLKIQKINAESSYFDENTFIGVAVDNVEEKIKTDFKLNFASSNMPKKVPLEKTQVDFIKNKKMDSIKMFCEEFGTENPVTISIQDDQLFINSASAEYIDKVQSFINEIIKEFKSVGNTMENASIDGEKKKSVNEKELYIRYCMTYGKQIITIYQGDMTQLRVDAIVNSANGKLMHNIGLAKAIVDAGGDEIQKESTRFLTFRNLKFIPSGDAILTQGGKLPCKYVIHAVGFNQKDFLKENVLSNAVRSTLEIADNLKIASIAFPAISSGETGLPLNKVVNVIVSTVKRYIDKKSTSLKEISFVDINQSVAEEFQRHVEHIFSSSSGKKIKGSLPAVTRSLTIEKGHLEKVKADIIVNSINRNLDFKFGALSRAILEKAGKEIETECKKDGWSKGNELIKTQGYNLPSTIVYHINLPHGGNHEKTVRKYMELCLANADEDGVSSIAFPSLGTGQLKYSSDVVAKVMTQTAYYHLNKPTTRLKDIFIIIYPEDTAVYKAFENKSKDVYLVDGINLVVKKKWGFPWNANS